MGEVFEVEDLELQERVALKIIRPDIASNPQIISRFKREILLGKRVSHPNVCRIHDLGSAKTENGRDFLFLTMEFLEGETLASRLRRGPLAGSELVSLVENLTDGLAAAHHAGILHRDFKSGNVMLVSSPSGTRAVITDFGLARAMQDTEERAALTNRGTVMGTVDYMAPEQLRGENLGIPADIYSLGVVLFEAVTGRRPFIGDSDVVVALQHLHRAPPSPRECVPTLEKHWEAAILRCLAKDPEKRFASAAEVQAALFPVSGARGPQRVRARPAVLASLLIGMVALIALTLWIYRAGKPGLLARQQRVAVLEFDNIGGDPAGRAFCEGLMEIVSSQLTELERFQGSLSVVPASDIRRDKVTSARDAQRDFGVTLVITGSAQRSPGGLNLTINVVDARQLKQLRSHSMFIPQTDPVSMQQGVITQITRLLDMQLRPEAQRRFASGATPVPGAYDFYLQGSGYLLNGAAATDQAVTEFQHALDRDPNYALAYAGIGQAYWNKYVSTKNTDWIDKAWQACRRSVELGPGLAEPHIALAVLNSGTGRYDEAVRESRLATQIDPLNDRAFAELARALDASGQPDQAEATLKQAISLRPGYWNNYARLGILYARHGRYSDAEGPFKRVVELAPDNPAGYTNVASIYHLEGREAEAERMLKQSIEVRPTPKAYADLATVYFFQHRYADAVPIMEKVVGKGTRDYMQWGNLGDAYRWAPGYADKSKPAYLRAIQLAEEAVKVNPRDASALSSMALYRAKLGDTTAALQLAQKAVSAAPDDKSILFKAAIAFELAGQRKRALEYLGQAVQGGYSLSEIEIEPELNELRKDPGYSVVDSHTNPP